MEHTPADPRQRTITTRDELTRALVDEFLGNADTGRHGDNGALIDQLGAWQRAHQGGDEAAPLPPSWR